MPAPSGRPRRACRRTPPGRRAPRARRTSSRTRRSPGPAGARGRGTRARRPRPRSSRGAGRGRPRRRGGRPPAAAPRRSARPPLLRPRSPCSRAAVCPSTVTCVTSGARRTIGCHAGRAIDTHSTRSRSLMRSARLATAALLAALTTLVPALATGTTAGGAQAASGGGADMVSRVVAFSLVNANSTADACSSDGRTYRVRGQLVGPRRRCSGERRPGRRAGARPRHGVVALAPARAPGLRLRRWAGPGGRDVAGPRPARLRRQPDPRRQRHLPRRPGRHAAPGRAAPALGPVPLRRVGPRRAVGPPRVLQGHAAGAAIAQLEAATYDDVDGLVLMSWTDGGAPPGRGRGLAAVAPLPRGPGLRPFAPSDRDPRAAVPHRPGRRPARGRGLARPRPLRRRAQPRADDRDRARRTPATSRRRCCCSSAAGRLNRSAAGRQQDQSYSSSVGSCRTTGRVRATRCP